MNDLISTNPDVKERLIRLALDGLASRHTCRAYRAALDEFLTWSQGQQPPVLCKALVHRYKAMLIEKEMAPATINQRLAAVRRLAQEAGDNGHLDASVASAIAKVRGIRLHGVRIGKWLNAARVRELLGIPDSGSVKGKRDRAVLAVLIGCGLRRAEVAAVSVEQFRIVEDRWVIADLVGKHGRIRTVAVPSWAKTTVDEWRLIGSIVAGRLFRHITKRAEVTGEGFTAQAVYDIVLEHARTVDPDVTPHDLRRSFARLAYEGHAPIEQLSMTLGHASIATTERYVAAKQHFRMAPCDLLNLDMSSQECHTVTDTTLSDDSDWKGGSDCTARPDTRRRSGRNM
jgi:site-specific recombinase XerD